MGSSRAGDMGGRSRRWRSSTEDSTQSGAAAIMGGKAATASLEPSKPSSRSTSSCEGPWLMARQAGLQANAALCHHLKPGTG